ncbi:MAG: hypothetical protein OSA88_13210 [Acidimicrobiales bacterium]|nr:hypothetical protein [Acidimicrobiales bacterium]
MFACVFGEQDARRFFRGNASRWGQVRDSGFNVSRSDYGDGRMPSQLSAGCRHPGRPRNFLAPASAPERSDQRRQDVVAIFGTMPPA